MNVWFIPQTLLTAAFLRAVLLGVVVGGVYDLTRAPRRAFSVRPLVSALLDGVFVLLLVVLVFCFFVVEAYGVPRGFIAGGIALGTALYFATLSPLVLLLLVALFTLFQKTVVFCRKSMRKFGAVLGKPLQRMKIHENFQKKSKFLFHFRTK